MTTQADLDAGTARWTAVCRLEDLAPERGAAGTDVPTLTAPMYKQVFDLETGRCLDGAGKPPLDLRTWHVVVTDGVVQVGGER
jgi:nitrite reductase/ring-hydroxylating ferredoxin subunit